MKQILLVRHGQASFGARDYDALSDRGHQQAYLLGRALHVRGVRPDVVIHGDMTRHRETVDGLIGGMGPAVAPPVDLDAGWDEFDFAHVMEVHKPLYRHRAVMVADLARTLRPRQAFEQVFTDATLRWVSGDHDDDYRESFPRFTDRVLGALDRVAARSPDRGIAVVVTSGGPIALALSHVLAGDASLWPTLNRIAVNTAVSKILHGSRGLTVSTVNGHEHLESDPDLLTYR
ncbi:histidine phosphatase family protein [Williamsia sp. MIQD14]|uniref:histidine phosphatase family protein n=1 Tax=Williamsia sp. MIQD14 TaxID=3425703 RepID=UPI003DA166D8